MRARRAAQGPAGRHRFQGPRAPDRAGASARPPGCRRATLVPAAAGGVVPAGRGAHPRHRGGSAGGRGSRRLVGAGHRGRGRVEPLHRLGPRPRGAAAPGHGGRGRRDRHPDREPGLPRGPPRRARRLPPRVRRDGARGDPGSSGPRGAARARLHRRASGLGREQLGHVPEGHRGRAENRGGAAGDRRRGEGPSSRAPRPRSRRGRRDPRRGRPATLPAGAVGGDSVAAASGRGGAPSGRGRRQGVRRGRGGCLVAFAREGRTEAVSRALEAAGASVLAVRIARRGLALAGPPSARPRSRARVAGKTLSGR